MSSRKLIVFFILIVVIGSILFFVSMEKGRIYTNKEYSYQLTMPVDFAYKEDTGDVAITKWNYKKTGTTPFRITVTTTETKLDELIQRTKDFYKGTDRKLTKETTYDFQGLKATRLEYTDQDKACLENVIGDCRGICTMFSKNNLTFSFCGVVFRSDTYDEFKKNYEETLNSFKFLK